MKSLTVVAFALILGGCQTTSPTLITTQNKVVSIPNEVINACPRVPNLPRASTLTEVQVADLIRRLYGNNSKCYQAMQDVRRLNDEAVATLEKR
jgi:uncharacterized lipoprotein YajG